MRPVDTTPFTAKQGLYLAFIYYYSKIHGMSPAEGRLPSGFPGHAARRAS